MTGSAVGIDVGGTKMLGVRLGPSGEVEARRKVTSPKSLVELAKGLAGMLAELGGRTGGRRPAGPIGVGVAGLVDRGGCLGRAPHLKGLAGTDVASLLATLGGVPLWVGNDASAAAWAEHQRGAARGAADALVVTLGTGIGAGVVVGGKLVLGAHGFAGEPGHMVVDPSGPACPCGRRGCWEQLASGSALARLARNAAGSGDAPSVLYLAGGDPGRIAAEHVVEAARMGAADALRVLSGFAHFVAVGLANLAELLDPEVIVLGGGVVEAAGVVLKPLRDAFAEEMSGGGRAALPALRRAALGESAGAVGAALLAVRAAGPRS